MPNEKMPRLDRRLSELPDLIYLAY